MSFMVCWLAGDECGDGGLYMGYSQQVDLVEVADPYISRESGDGDG
jgi:hypothetical protein